MRHPHKFLQCLQRLFRRLDQMLLGAGLALSLRFGQRAEAVLQPVVDVFGHRHHFFDDLLLEIKFGKQRLQLFVEFYELVVFAVAFGVLVRLAPAVVMLVHCLIHFPQPRHQPAHHFQVGVAAVHFFIEHHAVEAFARRVGQQFFRERNVFLAGEAKAVNDLPQFVLRRFDAFGNFHLLRACQQRHRPHLLEIHPHRIIQRIQPVVVFLEFLFVHRLHLVHLGGVHHLDFEIPQLGKNVIQLRRCGEFFREHFIDVLERQLPLLVGTPDEFLDVIGQHDRRDFNAVGFFHLDRRCDLHFTGFGF